MITISHVLCPIDFSEFSTHAVGYAVALARWYEARLSLLHVFVNMSAMDIPAPALEEAERARIAADVRALAGHPADVQIDARVQEASDAASEILAQADGQAVDLLVLGSHGRKGFERLLLGSVTETVLRKARCPVLVVPRGAPPVGSASASVRFSRILCPVDFSDASVTALTYALSIAQESDATLTVMHTIEFPPELGEHVRPSHLNIEAMHAAATAASLERLRDLIPDSARTFCTVETVVEEGAAYRHILSTAAAHEVDLIVMGVRGRGALDLMLFGSNTARVTRAAQCPVLVVR